MDEQGQIQWYYFVTRSGMSGVSVFNPEEVEEYRNKKGWREVSRETFDWILNRNSYDTRGMGYYEQ